MPTKATNRRTAQRHPFQRLRNLVIALLDVPGAPSRPLTRRDARLLDELLERYEERGEALARVRAAVQEAP